MSQRDVETLLGSLILSPELRARFCEYPEETVRREGYDLTPRELRALLRIDEDALSQLGSRALGVPYVATDPLPISETEQPGSEEPPF